MGQYIRTGIITEFSIDNSNLKEIKIGSEEARNGLVKTIIKNPESFDCREEEDQFIWTLKRNIVEKRLLRFLKRYFTDFYGARSDDYENRCKPVLDYLSKRPTVDEFYAWLDDTSELIYSQDEIVSLSFKKRDVNICISTLELTSEGKVQYEELDRHLRFFESAMRRAYADDPLGGCLMVTIE